ncbi:MAG: hypothetical protein ACLFNK_05070, partial [Candidatus Woesearchaeota archaeon]
IKYTNRTGITILKSGNNQVEDYIDSSDFVRRYKDRFRVSKLPPEEADEDEIARSIREIVSEDEPEEYR